MKRLFLLFSITTAALFSSYDLKAEAPERQGWKEDSPLYGDVESVVMTKYKLEEKSGEVVRGCILDYDKYYFNDTGDVIEYASYRLDGSFGYKHIYKYDSSGNMVEEALYNSDGSLFEKGIYKYDSSGNKIEGAGYNSDGSLDEKEIYKYDSSGNMIEEALYYSSGSLSYKHIYKYDSRGNVIEETSYQGKAHTPVFLRVYEITYRN